MFSFFGDLFNLILTNPIYNVLVGLYALVGNLGVAIIILTVIVKLATFPMMRKSMEAAKKQRDLMPEIEKLKKKHKNNQQKLAEAQMKLFQDHGINPASGCAMQIPTILIFAALFRVFRLFSGEIDIVALNQLIYFDFLKFGVSEMIHTHFLIWDMSVPDAIYVLPVLAGITQFVYSKMMMPYSEIGEAAAKKTPEKSDDLAYNMQSNMMIMLPLMTVIIGLQLPSGIVLYILISTVFSIVQQYFISGWGGLQPYFKKLGLQK